MAGYSFGTPLFAPDAVALIAKSSEGNPRNINNICFTALTLGAGLKRGTIRRAVICEALKELDLSESGPDEADSTTVGPEMFGSTTSMLNTPSGGFWWRPQFAAVALLLLALALCVNPRIRNISRIPL